MKKLTLSLLILVSISLNAQGPVSRSTLTTNASWSWIGRQVPTLTYLQRTFDSFYNLIDNPAIGTGSLCLTTAPTATVTFAKFIKQGGTSSEFLKADGSVDATTYLTSAVTSVGGTSNRITSTGGATPVLDISGSYVGQSSITTLGTIGTGIWNGTAIGDSYISSAATWNAKQAALVSGTNIKTVNSTSLLGSGNVAVQDVLVSGTNIKTVNSISLLGSGDISIPVTTLTAGSNVTVTGTNPYTITASSGGGGGGYAATAVPAGEVPYGNDYSTGYLRSDPAFRFIKDTALQSTPGEYQSGLNIKGNELGAGFSILASVNVLDANTNNGASFYYEALDNYAIIGTSLTTPLILNAQTQGGNVVTTTSVGLSIGTWGGWSSPVQILPSAKLDIAGGSTTQGQIRLRTGTALSTVVAGSHEYTSTQGHMLTDGNGRYRTVGTTSAATVGNNQIVIGLTNNRVQSYSNAQYDGTAMSLPHYSGTGSTLTGTVGTGAGTSGTKTITAGSDDFSGGVSVTTDVSGVTASAVIITITFNTAFSTAPTVILQPANAATALLSGTSMVYVNSTTTAFTINAGSVALVPATVYKWFYMAAQN